MKRLLLNVKRIRTKYNRIMSMISKQMITKIRIRMNNSKKMNNRMIKNSKVMNKTMNRMNR